MNLEHFPCAVVRIDIGAPARALDLPEGFRSVHVVYEHEGVPVATRVFTAEELPLPPTASASLAADAVAPLVAASGQDPREATPASVVGERKVAGSALSGSASIIVCTRDRPGSLERCLRALDALETPPLEIVVVDNAPLDGRTRPVVERFGKARYVAEPAPGLSRARNAGIAAASGDILAFTDDDTEVTTHWLAMLASGFDDPRTGCVTGLVLPADLSTEAAFRFEFGYGGLQRGFLPQTFGPRFLESRPWDAPYLDAIGAGASMALRRAALDDVGPFDERLGAGAAGCSEDTELWHRLLLKGWTCRYEPLASVFHHHRDSADALLEQTRSYMRGHAVALFAQYAQSRRLGHLGRFFLHLPRTYAKAGMQLPFGNDPMRRKFWSAGVAGLAEAPFYWLRHRSSPRYGSRRGSGE
ncbi:hypothetical protein GCM10011371_12800 [Novosphingobium marinum]|uniref:GT2 family glycosyltransferase n=1 Tax=Novosphingobium marinum TaxID=1514948 RepID=A0A7Z0BUN7_9SPHN|nr:glycosyltransferase [Novosphingobium marinum]NYH95388.1 GT2 family glycosyltransferase [Novosphingobium marinum]GGC26658.1 hypothetical protein GCM10011371_12800 [Novosphingobium marinum]